MENNLPNRLTKFVNWINDSRASVKIAVVTAIAALLGSVTTGIITGCFGIFFIVLDNRLERPPQPIVIIYEESESTNSAIHDETIEAIFFEITQTSGAAATLTQTFILPTSTPTQSSTPTSTQSGAPTPTTTPSSMIISTPTQSSTPTSTPTLSTTTISTPIYNLTTTLNSSQFLSPTMTPYPLATEEVPLAIRNVYAPYYVVGAIGFIIILSYFTIIWNLLAAIAARFKTGRS